jgi:tripartite ATP-independent transporter DctP family solute receptor
MLTRRHFMLAPLLLAGCGGRNEAKTRPLFTADTHPDEYPTVQALHAIDRLLDERTNGEMRLRIYAGGQMGAEKDTLEITVFGGLDLNRVNLAPLNSIVPETIVLALPFLFRSIPHARVAFDGSTGRKILDAMSTQGLHGLCYYDSGARSFYNTKRLIRTPDDMRGMKLRVQNSDIYVAMVSALGANPTPIPYGEVYQALVQGVVDGAENNWPSYESARHFEAAPYYSLTRHVMAPEVLVASERRWDMMTNEERDYLQAAAYDSVPIMRKIWDARVDASRSRLIESGVQVVEDLDREAFSSLMLPVWDQFLTDPRTRALAEEIVALEVADE